MHHTHGEGGPIRHKRRNEATWRQTSPPSPRPLWTDYGKLKCPGKPSPFLYLSSHHLLPLHTTPSQYSSPAECEVITVLLAGGENDYNLYGKQRLWSYSQERCTPEPGFFYHWERKKKCLKKSMLQADDCGMVIYNHAHWRNSLYLGRRVLMINNSSCYSRNIILYNVYFYYNIMPNEKLKFHRTN